jgi:hypothetical protein
VLWLLASRLRPSLGNDGYSTSHADLVSIGKIFSLAAAAGSCLLRALKACSSTSTFPPRGLSQIRSPVLITSAATRTWLGPLYAQNSCAVPVITSLAIYTRPFGVAITTFWNYSLVMPLFSDWYAKVSTISRTGSLGWSTKVQRKAHFFSPI